MENSELPPNSTDDSLEAQLSSLSISTSREATTLNESLQSTTLITGTISNRTSTSRRPITSTYSSSRVSPSLITSTLSSLNNIRNVCVLAHVDHGKTTLSDSLIASNGIISHRLAGQMRYMDSREDEQRRGITMQSSAVALVVDLKGKKSAVNSKCEQNNTKQSELGAKNGMTRYLVNLIDSPGHVDFAGQVITATRLCDGAIVVVDAVEGVCPQTLSVLRLAHQDNLTPTLFINKIDRLISELNLTPSDASTCLTKLVEQVNAANAMIRGDEFCFDPRHGNVLFGSATESWAFGIEDFVEKGAKRLEIEEDELRNALWGDYYFDVKTKKILSKSESGERSKTLFAALILESIWSVYSADPTKQALIGKSLSLTFDAKIGLRSLMGAWLPLAQKLFAMIVDKIPAPSCKENSLSSSISPEVSVVGEISKLIDAQGKLIGMARLFKGGLTVGQTIYVLQAKYDPVTKTPGTWTQITIQALYILMGRGDTAPVEQVYEGNVFGLLSDQPLEDFVYKAATISDSLECPSLLQGACATVQPLVRVALQPTIISNWDTLKTGLHALCQSDPSASYIESTSGELLLNCVGELHLEQCLKDLKERFCRCEIETSAPIVPFRETVIDEHWIMSEETKTMLLEDPDQEVQEVAMAILNDIQIGFRVVFTEHEDWTILEQGRNNCTLLFDRTIPVDIHKILPSIISAFRLAIDTGPFCGEPLEGVTFLICQLNMSDSLTSLGALITLCRSAIHNALFYHRPRLLLSTFSVSIQTTSAFLGRTYSLLSRRHSKILSSDYNEQTTLHTINASIPVLESWGFTDELRTKTSGLAMPQLVFSGFEMLDEDIFGTADKRDNADDEGDEVVIGRAQKYLLDCREKKGMCVVRPLVVAEGEKQRTLKKD